MCSLCNTSTTKCPFIVPAVGPYDLANFVAAVAVFEVLRSNLTLQQDCMSSWSFINPLSDLTPCCFTFGQMGVQLSSYSTANLPLTAAANRSYFSKATAKFIELVA